MSTSAARIGIVGATGLVGREALSILSARGVSASQLTLFASPQSAGQSIDYQNHPLPLQPLSMDGAAGIDWFLFAASAEIAQAWIPRLLARGAAVIDNSSAFRADDRVPLVIPEVNGELLSARPRLVANPNCSTIILLTALNPLKLNFGLSRVDVATYQAVSGAGAAAIDELRRLSAAALSGEAESNRVFPVNCAFNVFCHESKLDEASGLCGEEAKMVSESGKIWNDAKIRVVPFCVRVPVIRAHSQAITVQLERAASREEIQAAIDSAPGLALVDDRQRGLFPTPRSATGIDEILVGRIRPAAGQVTATDGRYRDWSLFVCGDQIRKGAALNAVQILQQLTALQPQATRPASIAR